jgi:glutathione S-transferase
MRLELPLARAVMLRAMAIDDGSVARARDQIRATFDRVATRLGSRGGHLVGDRFSAADLTFAAFAAPMVLPVEHPFPLPVALLPPSMLALVRECREHPAGTFALRVYAEHRHAAPSLTTRGDCRDR